MPPHLPSLSSLMLCVANELPPLGPFPPLLTDAVCGHRSAPPLPLLIDAGQQTAPPPLPPALAH